MPDSKLQKPGRFFALSACLIAAVVMVDQYTKWLVLETVLRQKGTAPGFLDWATTLRPVSVFLDQQADYNSLTLAPFLNFVMVWNRGVSFGMFDAGSSTTTLVLIGFSLFVCIALTIWLALARTRLLSVALPLIIGGALGNAIDRIRFTAVADFIDVHLQDRHWPAFNVADSCICLGAALLVIDTLISGAAAKETQPAA